MTTYTTIGSIRGCCDHNHRTLTGAARCLAKDQKGCESQGGYSDRRIVVLTATGTRPLSEAEDRAASDADR